MESIFPIDIIRLIIPNLYDEPISFLRFARISKVCKVECIKHLLQVLPSEVKVSPLYYGFLYLNGKSLHVPVYSKQMREKDWMDINVCKKLLALPLKSCLFISPMRNCILQDSVDYYTTEDDAKKFVKLPWKDVILCSLLHDERWLDLAPFVTTIKTMIWQCPFPECWSRFTSLRIIEWDERSHKVDLDQIVCFANHVPTAKHLRIKNKRPTAFMSINDTLQFLYIEEISNSSFGATIHYRYFVPKGKLYGRHCYLLTGKVDEEDVAFLKEMNEKYGKEVKVKYSGKEYAPQDLLSLNK